MKVSVAGAQSTERSLSSGTSTKYRWAIARSMRIYPQLWIGSFVLIVLILSAIAAPIVAPFGPREAISGASLQGPSTTTLFGADRLGRDVFSRVIYGGRVSLMISASAVVSSMIIGVAIGLIGGFREGTIDSILMRFVDAIMAFPNLILALTIAFVLGASASSVIIALTVVRLPAFARLVRGQVLSIKNHEYILAARINGATSTRIVWRHLLPNLTNIILVQASLSAGAVIFAEASLGFLGMSVPPPTPTWGGMLHDGYVYLERNPWLSIFPGAVISLAVLGFNFVGDGLRDRLDPHERRRRGG